MDMCRKNLGGLWSLVIRRVSLVCCITFVFACLTLASAAQQGWSEFQRFQVAGNDASLNSVFYDGDELWVVGASGLIQRSNDDGRSFEEVLVGGNTNFNDVYKRKDRVWIVGDGGLICVSSDGGKSFASRRYESLSASQSAGGQNVNPDLYSVYFVDKKRGYIVGDQGLIMRSTNGGYNWEAIESTTQAQLFHLSFSGKKGWAIGTGGVIVHTDDEGNTWYPQRSGTDKDLNRVYFITDKVGIITGDSGLILRTENGGAGWGVVNTGFSQPLFGLSFIDKKTGWVVGYGGTVIRTYDGGQSWIRQESSTQTDIFGVSFSGNLGFAIGRGGKLLKYYEKR